MSVQEDVGVQVQAVGHEPQNPPAQLRTAQEERRMAGLEVGQEAGGRFLQGGTEAEPEPEPAPHWD